MEEDVPVIPGLISGFRIFRIDTITNPDSDLRDLVLSSAYQRCTWKKGVNQARCLLRNYSPLQPACESIPSKDCNCGLQAYYDFNPDIILEPKFFERFAIASVVGGGNIFLHNQGWRAEKAQVTGLFIPDYKQIIEEYVYEKSLNVQKEVCTNYKVTLFSDYQEFKENSKKNAINLDSKSGLKPSFYNLLKKHTFGPVSLNDEIDLHGGDCSLPILGSLNNKDHQPGYFPKTLLKRKKGAFLPSSWRFDQPDRTGTLFYQKAVGVISETSSSKMLRLSQKIDSSKHYFVAALLVILLSVLFNLTDIIHPPLTTLVLGIVFVSVLFFTQKLRQMVRKKLIRSVNKKINSI